MGAETNFGDVFVSAGPTAVELRMGHPATGRHEAVLTYREARALADHLARLEPPAPPKAIAKGIFD